jgi:N-acetylglucosamine malate deacetylase 2
LAAESNKTQIVFSILPHIFYPTMRFLFVFPHPDDESFGPAGVIDQLATEGHEVFLLTLTKGGATKERFKLGLSIEAMGELRHREMLDVAKVLRLTNLTVLDLPDSGLAEMDPRAIEQVVQAHVEATRPDVVVSYAVHGISGFADHLVMHAVMKRLYLQMREDGATYLKRFAMLAMPETIQQPEGGRFRLFTTAMSQIDCRVALSTDNVAAFHRALDCYVSYQDVINASKVRETIGNEVCFEFFQEDCTPPVQSLADGLA